MIRLNGKKKVKKLSIRSKLRKSRLNQILISMTWKQRSDMHGSLLSKGNKVKVSCMFRGREMAHPELGEKLIRKVCEDLEDIAMVESPSKLFGRTLIVTLAPGVGKKKKEGAKQNLSVEGQPTGEEE